MKTICVFAGAASGSSPQFSKEAFRIGQMIGSKGYKIIYGGGRTGIIQFCVAFMIKIKVFNK